MGKLQLLTLLRGYCRRSTVVPTPHLAAARNSVFTTTFFYSLLQAIGRRRGMEETTCDMNLRVELRPGDDKRHFGSTLKVLLWERTPASLLVFLFRKLYFSGLLHVPAPLLFLLFAFFVKCLHIRACHLKMRFLVFSAGVSPTSTRCVQGPRPPKRKQWCQVPLQYRVSSVIPPLSVNYTIHDISCTYVCCFLSPLSASLRCVCWPVFPTVCERPSLVFK